MSCINVTGRLFFAALCWCSFLAQGLAQSQQAEAVVIDCEKAEFAYLDGNSEEALIYLKRCRQQLPDYLPALTLLAKIQTEYGRYNLAVDTFQQALEQGADAELFAREWSRSLIAARQFESLISFTGFKAFTPTMRADWLKQRAVACRETNNDNCARESYAALQLLGEELEAALGFAELAIENKAWQEAEKQLEVAASMARNDIRVLLASGRLALYQQHYDEAFAFVDKASVLAPQDPLVLRTLVDVYLAANQRAEAANTLDLILSLTPEDPFAMLVRNSLNPTDKYAEILANYKARIEQLDKTTKANNQTLYYLEGLVAYQSGSYEQALKAFTFLVKERAFYPQTLTLLARTHVALKQPGQAIVLLDPAQDTLLAEAPKSMALLIELFIEDGKVFKALPAWRSFANRYPQRLETGLLEVKILFARGMQDRAIQRLEQLQQSFPESEEVARVSAVALSFAGDYAKALRVVEQQLQHSAQTPVWLNFKGTLHLMSGDAGNARMAFEKALSREPNMVPAQANLAWLDFYQGNKSSALQSVEELVAQYPAQLPLQQMYAGMLLSSGQTELAQQRYESLYKQDGTERSVIESLIAIYQQEGNTAGAIKMLTRLIALEHDTARNLLRRAQLYVSQQESNRADLDIYKALPLSNGDATLLLGIANISIQSGNQRLAVKSLQQARLINPDDPLPPVKLAELYLNQNQTEEAGKVLQAASDMNNIPELWLLKGRLAEQQGQAVKASEYYHHALRLNPEFELAYAKLYGLTRYDIGKEAFEEALKKRVAAAPDNVFSRSLLGQYYYYEQRFREAEPHYEQLYLTASEDSKKAGYARRLAQLYFHFDPQKAIEYVAVAEAINPADPYILPLKGWGLVQRNRMESGLKLLREAYTRNGQDDDTQYFLAHTLNALGMREEARKFLTPLVDTQAPSSYPLEIQQLHQLLMTEPD
ncbi:MAG: tetratricopeptide repeat protein [Pseudomonadota bacterium]|nr:tetratricopeptide repeat protein [Alteromonas sp.]MDY6927843.1 tetratricopeptide repeat protein [Pseudomonadota bacterium]